jgi:hypothetical protein
MHAHVCEHARARTHMRTHARASARADARARARTHARTRTPARKRTHARARHTQSHVHAYAHAGEQQKQAPNQSRILIHFVFSANLRGCAMSKTSCYQIGQHGWGWVGSRGWFCKNCHEKSLIKFVVFDCLICWPGHFVQIMQ